jgi:hypothetical protein
LEQPLLEAGEHLHRVKGRARHRQTSRATSSVQGQRIAGPSRISRVADGSNRIWSGSSTVATT